LSTRRCPRCQATYPAPARYCVKDGALLVEEAGRPAVSPRPRPHPLRLPDPPDPRSEAASPHDPLAPAPDPASTLSGKTLDRRYRVGKRLGEGGMSYVYRAEELETGRQVAVKILLPRLSRDPASVERLRREATIAMRLDHPNVCPILRLGETPERLIYLVMPFLEGEPLSEQETRRGPFSVSEGIPLLVNDRVDVALAAESDGVHIGQDDIPVPDARLLLGRGATIGLSVKTVEQAKAAPLELLDYVAIGGVYGTTSKDNTAAPIGIDGLRAIVDTVRARKANFPICAIAGITAANAGDVIAAGADGVAVISALSLAPDPAKAAQDLRAVVDGALNRRKQP